jgi:hypothetical protein
MAYEYLKTKEVSLKGMDPMSSLFDDICLI